MRTGLSSHRDARGLGLEAHPLRVRHQVRQFGVQLLEQCLLGRLEGIHEAHVELRAVAADQVHLGGQPGQHGQVTQRPAGDHRDGRGGQRGEGAQRRH